MKIVGIVSSPHREGMTAALTQRALAGAQSEGAETVLLRLVDEELAPCVGCGGGCWDTQICVRDPEATGRSAQLQDADGIVVSVPVYCWQLNGLMSLFVDKMRWNTRSLLQSRNSRAAFGIACAGGSGTGCVLALQALYRYFANWAFHGIDPLPVTKYNYQAALREAERGGRRLAWTIQAGIEPFGSMGATMRHYEQLPYMDYQPLDELSLIVDQQCQGLVPYQDADEGVAVLFRDAALARELLEAGDRDGVADPLSRAYHAGRDAWARLRGARP